MLSVFIKYCCFLLVFVTNNRKRGIFMENHTLTILIIEDDVAACRELRQYIENISDLKLVGITSDAEKAIGIIQSTLPDVVILDIELHHGAGNGITFLAMLNALNLPLRPYILITTNNSSNVTYESARSLGADFIMSKHKPDYSAQYVVEFIRMIQHAIMNRKPSAADAVPLEDSYETNLPAYTRRVYRELDWIGISPKNIGYRYLADSILLIIRDSSTNVYKEVAKMYKKSDASVERAMQNAINRAWRHSDIEELLTHYTAKVHSEKGVPTTLEFVYYYANKIKTDM